ncbi:MAG: hypothetical protein ACI4AK_04885 [Lepagella sp.]
MANIKKMQMWEDISNDSRISVIKSMMGLRTKTTYTPTGSVIEGMVLEYSVSDGDKLKQLLERVRDKQATATADFHPKKITNGNYIAEVCGSRDHRYLAIQLMKFMRLNYEPVTGVEIYEGEEAERLFKVIS